MRRALFLVLPLFVLMLATAPGRAEDWPEFRGPTGEGHVSGKLPVEWSPTKNVAWKQPIPGNGWSSPSIVGGKIYLTTAVPEKKPKQRDDDYSLQALCLDANSGAILWQKELFHEDGATAPAIHSKNSHASPTPLIYGGRIYVHFGHMGTACLDSAGTIIWKNSDIHYEPVHGNGGSPALVDNALIFSCDGRDSRFVIALDAATGKQLWRTERTGEVKQVFSFSTPLVITVAGRRQVISAGSNQVVAYDPLTGDEIWKVRYVGYSVIPRPVFGHGLVYICTGYNTPSLLAIKPDGTGDVTTSHVAWTVKKAVPHSASLLLNGDELYMVSDAGIASCLDAKTGKVHWQERLGGGYSASPIDADGKVYFLSEQGVGTVLQAGATFKVLAKNALEEKTLASYAAVDGALFIRTEKYLYRIETK